MEIHSKKLMKKLWIKLENNHYIEYKMAQAHENQDAIQRGEVQPPAGLNYMEEQYFKYGISANYHPVPIVGTDLVQGLHHNMTPSEYTKFFNYQRPQGGLGSRQMNARYKPKGIDYKMYGDRYHRGAGVLEDKERLVEFSRRSGITTADQIRNTSRPDLNANEGNFSNTFLSSG